MADIPVLLADEFNGVFRAWCPWCCIYHVHSAEEGHRVAHCGNNGPFRKTGYWLVHVMNVDIEGQFDPDVHFNKDQHVEAESWTG